MSTTNRDNESIYSIQLVMDAIQNNDVDTLILLLQKMPLDKLNPFESSLLLNRFLTVAASYNRSGSIAPILDTWTQIFPEDQTISFFTSLFLDNAIDIDALKFVASVFPDTTYTEVMDELTSYDSSEQLLLACQRAIDVYGEQSRNVYQVINNEADEKDNYIIYNFTISKLEETADYAEVPPWVKNFTNSDQIPKESEVKIPEYKAPVFELPNLDEAIILLTEGLENLGITIEDIDESRRVLRARLSIANELEKRALLLPILEKRHLDSLQTDVELFRILGPANPLVDSDLTQMKYGGSRMFIANDFDYDEELEEYFDWFRGVCDYCHQKIRIRYHAVRLPRPHGGWLGCYCSINCLRGALEDKELSQGRPDLASRTMIDSIEEQLIDIGIQDRLPDKS